MHIGKNIVPAAMILSIVILMGCDQENERLAAMAEKQLERQVEQNRQVTGMAHEVAAGSSKLVEADGAVRKELLSWQGQMQGQLALLHQERDELERERIALAAQRHWEPILASTIGQFGLVLACILPLLVCLYLLHPRAGNRHDVVMAEALITDLVAPEPLFGPAREQFPRLEARS